MLQGSSRLAEAASAQEVQRAIVATAQRLMAAHAAQRLCAAKQLAAVQHAHTQLEVRAVPVHSFTCYLLFLACMCKLGS